MFIFETKTGRVLGVKRKFKGASRLGHIFVFVLVDKKNSCDLLSTLCSI